MRVIKNQEWDQQGNLLFEEVLEIPYTPLEGYQLVAALNAALGIWSLTEAANIANVSEEHLIEEVLAWFIASEMEKHNAD